MITRPAARGAENCQEYCGEANRGELAEGGSKPNGRTK